MQLKTGYVIQVKPNDCDDTSTVKQGVGVREITQLVGGEYGTVEITSGETGMRTDQKYAV